MTILKWAYFLFAFFYVLWAPGYVLGKMFYPRERLAVRMVVGLVLTVTVVPLACFGLAMAFRTNVSELLIFSVASAILLAGMFVQLGRLRKKTGALEE